MQRMLPIWLLWLVVVSASPLAAPLTTFDVVNKSRVCQRSAVDAAQLDCEYRVSASLHFTIAGVGTPDAGIIFSKSDIDGDYYAAFGIQHGCVIVWPGRGGQTTKIDDLAFVSPFNGKVYPDWSTCARHA